MTKYLEDQIREMLSRCGRPQDAEAVISYYYSRDGHAREDVLLAALDDGFLVVYGFCEKEGPLYFFPIEGLGKYWEQVPEKAS